MTVYVVSPCWSGVLERTAVLSDELKAKQYAWDLCCAGDAREEDDNVHVYAADVDAPSPPSDDPIWSSSGNYFLDYDNLPPAGTPAINVSGNEMASLDVVIVGGTGLDVVVTTEDGIDVVMSYHELRLACPEALERSGAICESEPQPEGGTDFS